MKSQRHRRARYRELGRPQRVFILLVGAFWVIVGTVYFGLLTGWSAGTIPLTSSHPSLQVKASQAWFLVDQHGIVRGAMPHDRPPLLPQLRGIDARALLGHEFSEVTAAQSGGELATLLSGSGADQARDLQLNFSDPQNIVASLNGTTIQFGQNDFHEKWARIMHVRGVRSMTSSSNHEFDLRFPNTVIVRER